MQVLALQQFLNHIAPFVAAAGASESIVKELRLTVECLEPFREVSLAEFNKFLKTADECIRTNKFPEPPTKKERAKKSAGPKPAKITVGQAAQKFLSLKERATDPSLAHEVIESEIETFMGLTGAQLKELSTQINTPLPAKAKTKPEMVAEFKRVIKELKESREFNSYRQGEPAPMLGSS